MLLRNGVSGGRARLTPPEGPLVASEEEQRIALWRRFWWRRNQPPLSQLAADPRKYLADIGVVPHSQQAAMSSSWRGLYRAAKSSTQPRCCTGMTRP